ncbi:prephenate dehydratase [Cytophagaceae bacterium 50C-KIRBA]|uniref:Bifunctional chorismate mutase/prephenate dehydratase n=1 Tax=Aquirufa beregesia TaxID=2516556 RepID=A0ABX0ET28_9BACT|nr:prephenate dehydratase [Aquirufa beregesia]NGZ43153.1 prephenate dehydratase [Aquirufa beregesia]
MKSIQQLRESIDTIDDSILKLLVERMEFVEEIGRLKRENNTVIYHPDREKEIVDRLASKYTGKLSKAAIEAIFLEIFGVSRNLELPEIISFLGPEGSFTHQAAESRFGAVADYISLPSIRSVFDSVETGRAKYGVVPIENNQEGMVKETMDLLNERNLFIISEIIIPVNFCLASKENSIHQIQKIYSKDIAFQQCKGFLQDYFNYKSEDFFVQVDSTSKAAKLAVEDTKAAALCSHIAAKIYSLPILFDNIQDSEANQTRFFIISKVENLKKTDKDKTSLAIKLKHDDKPGALLSLLKDFEDVQINLLKIESRPQKDTHEFKFWFFIDIEGNKLDENVQQILDKRKDEIIFLGSYMNLC